MRRTFLYAVVPTLSIELCGAAVAPDPAPSAEQVVANQSAPAPAASTSDVGAIESSASAGASGVGHAPRERSLAITSDSQAFCTRLVHAIESHGLDTSRDVQALRSEGEQLCAEGRVRLGVARLREALVALKEEKDP
ncbi:hypothetical protein [Acetobacter sp. DsW_063]|uniref:hypothetical protein n=1 Tax=Acetobacter sp. DsW_063 TaxID=1514894 RepID=UPI000A396524|nr:hypothetical protein [Acetobacter sp. DsW_063]